MAYLVSLLLLIVFTVNVVIGAVGDAPLFGNVVEAMVLFAAAIAFSVGILQSEAREKAAQNKQN